MIKQDTIAYLMVNGSSINTKVSVHNQYDIQDPLPTGTKFEYIVDHSIRLINTNICIVANKNNQIMAENCTENTSRWILDLINYHWISLETGLCITLHDEEEGRVRLATLKTCSRQGTISENQKWVIEILTTNPDVLDNFPDASIDEFEEIQLEQRTSVTTTVSSPIFGGLLKRNHGRGNIIWDMIGWGLMKHGKSPDEKCLTHNGVNKPITLEACDPNWIKCQTSLPQTTVANCSEASSKGQAFEYSSDFTIRPFNTNNCIKANTTMLILHECSDKSSIWGTFDHTGQLMASDRTGLHSGASDRKCLTRRIDKLSLGHCHGTSQKQHFSFEYRNPHQPRTLSAAAIISLHTQHALFGKNLPILPPLNHRDPKEINYKTNATEGITKNSTITTKSATSMTATTDKSVIPSIAATASRQQKENTAHEIVVDDYRPLNDANTSNGLPKSTEELSDLIKYELGKMHEQYKISIESEHDNKLAKEIRDVYCQLSKIKRTQAIILAQTNGLLAAAALGLPMCTRIYGFGQAMTLQQCDPKRISLTAKETKCGFQPFFVYGKNNCTIGLDGWSIHPYSECFWKSQLININGYPHTWQHNATAGDWIKQEATIHTSNLDLIAEFEELHLNSFDYGLRNHPAHGTMEMEQLNILNDLVGRINEGEGKELPDILVTEEQDNQIGNIFSWFDTLKIMALSAIGFILFLICLRIFIACNPIPRIKESFRRRKQSRNVSESDGQEMDSMIPEPIYSAGGANEKPFIREFAPLMTSAKETPKETLTSINTPSAPKKGKLYPIEELKWENEQNKECTGSHTNCSYVVGYGMKNEELTNVDWSDEILMTWIEEDTPQLEISETLSTGNDWENELLANLMSNEAKGEMSISANASESMQKRYSDSESNCEFMQERSFISPSETEGEETSSSKVGYYYSKIESDLDPSSSDSEMAANCKAVSVINNEEEQETWSLPVPLITQTAYCKNCMMKTFPAMDTEITRRRIVAITMLMKGEFNYNLLEVSREMIRNHLLEARENGKNIKQILDTVFPNGTALLHGSVIKERFDVTDMFLQYGADSNIYEEGMTIAHRAAADNNVHLLRILSHHGNTFNIQNSMGESPLLVAIALNNMECIKYLWMDRIIVHQTLDEETVLYYAAKYNNKFVAEVAVPLDSFLLLQKDSRRAALYPSFSVNRLQEWAHTTHVWSAIPDFVHVELDEQLPIWRYPQMNEQTNVAVCQRRLHPGLLVRSPAISSLQCWCQSPALGQGLSNRIQRFSQYIWRTKEWRQSPIAASAKPVCQPCKTSAVQSSALFAFSADLL
ncbi:hypothetical protein OUZ56_033634 [Daphnia magna]|uniref:Ricin B lectin domain-containing protein n=1 Tax=Daphnia magna TaxID=35525 RepID=A0ABR0BAX6_9CRUS|nr:hypothetical protein OUZ56_033634 [Daphnia magna]